MMMVALTAKSRDSQTQWGHQETREFVGIRADLEKNFTLAKRNKTLWEVVSAKMRERGHTRTPDQCKCKWKNLVNRYKGKETTDPDNDRQCPFFKEVHAIFTERAKNMQRKLLRETEASSGQAKKRMKIIKGDRSSDDFPEDEDENKVNSDEERHSRKRKAERIVLDRSSGATSVTSSSCNGIQEMLKEFLQQQQRMEILLRMTMQKRLQEQQLFEQEWQEAMKKFERERLMVEQAWREKEEERGMREEIRAERRDTLLTSLLNKLIYENDV